jgi:uncharacterized protein YigE (DUF2233 family)
MAKRKAMSAVNPRFSSGLFSRIIVCFLLCNSSYANETIAFSTVISGMEIAHWNKDSRTVNEPSDIVIIRLNPSEWKFSTHHYKQDKLTEIPSAFKWRKILNSNLVVNAGQYTPDLNHLGWLLSDGKNIGSKKHSVWDGFFCAEPKSSQDRIACILDAKYDQINPENFPYKEAAQSMMLFDRTGKIRVTDSDKAAHRSAIAEDGNGRIVLFVSSISFTLTEFADRLMDPQLNLKCALSLDGGAEAQISLKYAETELTIPNIQIGLPSILSVSPRN